ncbi:MAG: ExeM/NucH family extracellular endonuclease [Woeseiaceae bacterium]|nr:ExeM/NucH family extracellular endonuclease [Woeseiaceae bacterium]
MRKSTLVLAAFMALANSAVAQDLVITGVIDGPLSGGVPKAVEVYVVSDAPDLSIFGIGSASNGGGTDGQEFTFPAVGASAGDFIYVSTQEAGFTSFFGFAPDYISTSAASINGDDAIELFKDGAVVDLFGEIDVDGTGDPWEYLDGWAYRVSGTGPDGNTFALGNWTFSGPNALDGETTNATADAPFPIATFSQTGGGPTLLINEVDADQSGTDAGEFVELFDGGAGNTDLTGLVLVFFNGSDDASYLAFDLDGYSTNADGYFVLCGDAANVANCDLDVSPDTNLIQNGADAVALLTGDAASFPNDTPVTTDNLIDAIVYDTSDSDDAGLLVLLNAGQPQVDERGGGNGTGHSNQRCPDGSGGARNTTTYAQFAPTPGAENICVAPAEMAFIHEIQGSGLVSPEVGNTFIIEGIVVGDFQDGASGTNGDLNGFYVQEEDLDADPDAMTSEGIFVYNGSSPAVDVVIGDLVRVEGAVSEFRGLTEITSFTGVEVLSSDNPLPTASAVTLPVTRLDDYEAFEGMLVTFPQALVISEYFNFDRFNEIVLTSRRHLTPTAEFEPGTDALQAAQDFLLDRIVLDDGRTAENPDPAIHPTGEIFDLTNLFRGGDTVQDVTGVMHESFSEYRIHPTEGANYVPENPRTDQPAAVGGNLKVASFNVLNYFTTLDEFPNRNTCGPEQILSCRGADNAEEFTRQRDKIIAAISVIDADVVGVIEIENNVTDDAVIDLVDGLNVANGAGTYDYVVTGTIGTDAIKNALIYKPATVSLAGSHAILDSSVDPNFIDTRNRPVLAQSFMERATGGVITVAVNHLKSKGSSCSSIGDPDLGDGSGNCNGTRTAAAEALVDWLATDPTGSGNNDQLIIGDLNSYDKETPIDAIRNGGFTDLIHDNRGEDAYTFVFDGQTGYLDYALASGSLLDAVTGVAVWHINADEPDLIDYDTSFKKDNQDAIYAADAYRASDHDPVIAGLDVCDDIPPTFEEVTVTPNVLWPPNHKYVDIAASVIVGDNGEAIPTVSLVSVTSNEPDNGDGDGNTVDDIVVVDDFKYMLRAERSGGGTGRIYTITYLATDSCDNSATATTTVTVPHSKGKKRK